MSYNSIDPYEDTIDTLEYIAIMYYFNSWLNGTDNNKYSSYIYEILQIYEKEFENKIKNNIGIYNLYLNDKLNINLVGEKSIKFYICNILEEIAQEDNFLKLINEYKYNFIIK